MSTGSVAEGRARLSRAEGEHLRELIEEYDRDERSGIQDAVAAARRRLTRFDAERRRLEALHALEASLRTEGFKVIAGVDEVGRGALAGPVTAAAVVLPHDVRLTGLDDSKRLSPARRESLAAEIRSAAVTCAYAHVPAHVADGIGMTHATRRAIELALARLEPAPDHAVTDGLRVGLGIPETPVVKGDGSVAAIAAASILAKVERDHLMVALSARYPQWEFSVNKGYGTPEHLAAIAAHGICPLHRRSFAPCSASCSTADTLF